MPILNSILTEQRRGPLELLEAAVRNGFAFGKAWELFLSQCNDGEPTPDVVSALESALFEVGPRPSHSHPSMLV